MDNEATIYRDPIKKPYSKSNMALKIEQINILFAAPKNIAAASNRPNAISSITPKLSSRPKITFE
jgi:hypothetical protein